MVVEKLTAEATGAAARLVDSMPSGRAEFLSVQLIIKTNLESLQYQPLSSL